MVGEGSCWIIRPMLFRMVSVPPTCVGFTKMTSSVS